MSYVEIKNLSVQRGGRSVLRDLDLKLESTQVLGLLGASGSGKTTLLRAIAGFEPVSHGSISVDGVTWASPREWVRPEERRCGFVFQDFALFSHLSVKENIGFGLKHLSRIDRDQQVRSILRLVELEDLATRNVKDLSGGQRQRVAIARAIAPKPKLLLLDEPFSQVDRGLKQDLIERLKQVLEETKTTAICVLHQAEDAAKLATRIAVLENGRLAVEADPAEVFECPPTRGVSRVLGDFDFVSVQASGQFAALDLMRIKLASQAEGALEVLTRPRDFWAEPDSTGAWIATECVFGMNGPVVTLSHEKHGIRFRANLKTGHGAVTAGTRCRVQLSDAEHVFHPVRD